MQLAPPRVAQINVTPMIDLMLVLLMLFMIVRCSFPPSRCRPARLRSSEARRRGLAHQSERSVRGWYRG
jgi:biopolymer transport protein ExbD